MMLKQGLTSREVVALSGCTYRQLDYWARTLRGMDRFFVDHAKTPGSGNHRRWTPDVVPVLVGFLAVKTAVVANSAGFPIALVLGIADALDEGRSVMALDDRGLITLDLDRVRELTS